MWSKVPPPAALAVRVAGVEPARPLSASACDRPAPYLRQETGLAFPDFAQSFRLTVSAA